MYPLTNKRYYFVSGNTTKGFFNLLHTNIKNIDQIFVLNHPSYFLKTAILKELIHKFEDHYNLEIIYSAVGTEYLEGIIIRERSLAFITDTIKGNINNVVNVSITDDQIPQKDFTGDIKKESEHLEEAYEHFTTALKIHDDLEKIYIREMDFSKADEMAENFIHKLLTNISPKNRQPHIYRRLFGATTANGPINIVPQVFKDLSHRVYIKGRAGTGKSVFMKKVAKACEDYGLNIEMYHCSFDPDSIDMVLVPDLDFCIFDSTDPHAFNPEKDGDIIIDLYKDAVAPGVDERYSKEIDEVTKRYKSSLQDGVKSLQRGKSWRLKIERNYVGVDESIIKKITEDLIKSYHITIQ